MNFWCCVIIVLLVSAHVQWKTTQFNPIADYRRLYKIDKDFRHVVLTEFRTYKNWTKHVNNLYKYRADLVGSLHEGAFFARFFKRSRLGTKKFNRGLDVDLEITIAHIGEQKKHCIQDLANKPGFVHYAIKSKDCYVYDEHIYEEENDYSELTRDGFLKPDKIKQLYFRHNALHNHTSTLTVIKAILAYIYKTSMSNINLQNIRMEITKATATFSMVMQIEEQPYIYLGLDTAFIIRLMWTPNITLDWIRRERNWTSLTTNMAEELSYGYIILKSSNEEKSNKETVEIRYSFAHLERKIVSMQSDTQKLVYLIFKATIYQELLEGHLEDIVSSYIGKTVMLWTCEKFPPSHKFWDDDDLSILRILTYLFEKLYQGFQRGFLPYYFIPKINVIGHLPDHVVRKLTNKLETIRHDVRKFIARGTHTIVIAAELSLNLFNSHKMLFRKVVTKQHHSPDVYKLLLERPDIFLPYVKELVHGK